VAASQRSGARRHLRIAAANTWPSLRARWTLARITFTRLRNKLQNARNTDNGGRQDGRVRSRRSSGVPDVKSGETSKTPPGAGRGSSLPALPPPVHRDSANAAISLELANDRAEGRARGAYSDLLFRRTSDDPAAERRITLAPRGEAPGGALGIFRISESGIHSGLHTSAFCEGTSQDVRILARYAARGGCRVLSLPRALPKQSPCRSYILFLFLSLFFPSFASFASALCSSFARVSLPFYSAQLLQRRCACTHARGKTITGVRTSTARDKSVS